MEKYLFDRQSSNYLENRPSKKGDQVLAPINKNWSICTILLICKWCLLRTGTNFCEVLNWNKWKNVFRLIQKRNLFANTFQMACTMFARCWVKGARRWALPLFWHRAKFFFPFHKNYRILIETVKNTRKIINYISLEFVGNFYNRNKNVSLHTLALRIFPSTSPRTWELRGAWISG